MNYDKQLLEQVLRDVESEKIKLETESRIRLSEVYQKLPRVAEIDVSLRSTVLDVIRASFGKGEDTAALISKTRETNLTLQREREALLISAGFPANYTDAKSVCEVCDGEGYANGELCPCVIERYRKSKAAKINSRLNLSGADFAKFDISLYPENGGKLSPRSHMREVFEFSDNFAKTFDADSENLFFNGGSGLGKTFLASCIAKVVSEKGFSVVYETAFSLFGAYEDVKFGRSDADTSVYEACDLLIIDDVGSEMATPFANAVFLNLVNIRKNRNLKTIIISTLAESEIKKRYGDQMFSRIRGDFLKLEFLGDDVRLMR